MLNISGQLSGTLQRVFVVLLLIGFLLVVATTGVAELLGVAMFLVGLVGTVSVWFSRNILGLGRSVHPVIPPGTAFAPRPQPSAVIVKCAYCGLAQPFSEKCRQCGAPLPSPV